MKGWWVEYVPVRYHALITECPKCGTMEPTTSCRFCGIKKLDYPRKPATLSSTNRKGVR